MIVLLRHVVFGRAIGTGAGVQLCQTWVLAQSARETRRADAECRVPGVAGIVRIEERALVVGDELSVPVVGAALRDGVDHATESATVLGFEAGRLDLNFLDELVLEVLA